MVMTFLQSIKIRASLKIH